MASLKRYRRYISADNWVEYIREDHVTDQEQGVPAPPVQKPYAQDSQLIDLIPADQLTVGRMPLAEVIGKRRSRRKYSKKPLTLEELSFLLWATQGMRKAAIRKDGILRSYRTVPSAGARHPLETYLVISRVTGIEPGLYRYLPVEHKLLIMRRDPALAGNMAKACLDQPFIGTGAVVFVWTTIPYRSEWRYSIVAHKMIAQDSGHLCQNLYLAAEAIEAGACAVAAYDQKAVDELLGVDGEDEFVIYLSPVGKLR